MVRPCTTLGGNREEEEGGGAGSPSPLPPPPPRTSIWGEEGRGGDTLPSWGDEGAGLNG